MEKAKTVFVGLSGGVDSSVAAARLRARGFTVVGVFIKVWQPPFLNCNWEAERLDAMRVAAHLDIPFLTCDAQKEYETQVADYFIQEYLAGRTPNPDVMCNKSVKFGAFLDFAIANGADYVATGHYAQVQAESAATTNHTYSLLRGVDTNKDQSYFLWTLTQAQLQRILLPVGDSTKEQIRHEAQTLRIPVATKKDSQGICFLGHINIKEFLSHYTTLVPGDVRDENNNRIGTHDGALIYTLGQRHGFTIESKNTNRTPYFVINKNLETNTITVSTKNPIQESGNVINLRDVHSINADRPLVGKTISAQFRYRQKPFGVKILSINADNTLSFELLEQTDRAASGQSCVLYEGQQCLGGGIIA